MCDPPDANAASVAGMEDVLEIYQRPRDLEYPVVCVDETSKQLIAEARVPIAAKPGQPARHNYAYERDGTANLFMIFAPLKGWRHVDVTYRHAAVDYAQVLKDISDTYFPKAKKIVGHAFGVLAFGGSLRDGAGQSQHPQAGVTLRSVSRRRSAPAG
jgi:hypothetical protein